MIEDPVMVFQIPDTYGRYCPVSRTWIPIRKCIDCCRHFVDDNNQVHCIIGALDA